jgi:hypothetical protein
MWWRDGRLDYSDITKSTNKIELDTRQIDKVWQPNIYFENEKRAFVHEVTTTNQLMHIFSDGTVVYSIRWFPFMSKFKISAISLQWK